MKNTLAFTLLVGIVVFLAGTMADAAVISVNFGGTGSNPDGSADSPADITLLPGDITGVVPVGNWNNAFGRNFTSGTLVDDSGSPTSLSFTTSGMDFNWSYTSTPGSAIERLLNGVQGGNGNGSLLSKNKISVTNVPYALYDVILYHSAGPNPGTMMTLSSAGYTGDTTFFSTGTRVLTSFIQTTGTTAGTATTSGNYTRWEGLTDPSFVMNFVDFPGYDGGNRDGLGFQVIEIRAIVPEPSTFLMWSLGLIGLAWYARRRRTK